MKKYLLICYFFLLALVGCKSYVWKAVLYNNPGLQDDKFLPYREVKTAKPQALSLSDNRNQIQLPDSVQKALDETGTVAFLVVKNQEIVYEKYEKGYDVQSEVNPFSVTKSLISMLVGIALQEGKIKSLDEPIATYYPDYKENGREKITFRHLLYMQSGLKWKDDYLNPFSQIAELFYGNNLPHLVNSLEVEKPAGSESRYKNCDTQVLGLALSAAIGGSLSDYAAEKIWQPIGAEIPAHWLTDRKNGVEKTYCCFHSNARDFARIGLLYLNKGNWNGVQIIDSNYVKESTKTAVKIKVEMGKNKFSYHNYGMGWWTHNLTGTGDYSAQGMKGQMIIVLPQDNMVIVRLGKKQKRGLLRKILSIRKSFSQ